MKSPHRGPNPVVLILFFCLVVCLRLDGKGPRMSNAQIEAYRIVAVRLGLPHQEQAIAVNEDGRVLLLVSKDGNFKYSQTLGFKCEMPESSPFLASLPKDEVPIQMRPLSSSEGKWRLWIVLTIGFRELKSLRRKDYYGISNILYVFRKSPRGIEELLSQPVGEVTELVVDDVNGDHSIEIAVQSVETGASPVTTLQIWQVQNGGELNPIPLVNVEKDLLEAASSVVVGLRDYRAGDTGVYTEQRIAAEDGWLLVTKYYKWNPTVRRFELERVARTKQTIIK